MNATPGISLEPPADLQSPPVLDLNPEQVEGLVEKLHQFWQRFAPLFQRREQREWGLKYIIGRLLEGKKYFTNALARRLGEQNERAMQNFIGSSPWEDQLLVEEHQRAVQEYLGEKEGLIIMDGTGFPRKGTESAGVARQYCNETGKVDNCQVGIYLAYASSRATHCWTAGCTCRSSGSTLIMLNAASAAVFQKTWPFARIRSWPGRCWRECTGEER